MKKAQLKNVVESESVDTGYKFLLICINVMFNFLAKYHSFISNC